MNLTIRHKALGLLSLAIIVALLAIYFTAIQIDRADKIAVKFDVLPSDAQVVMNDNTINRGTLYLEEGAYDFEASRQGFKDYSDTIIVDSNTSNYAIFLEADSKEGEEWLANNRRDYERVRKVNDAAVKEAGEAFSRNNPIASKLPYRSFLFTIGYQLDKSDPTENSIIIVIDAREPYRQAAINKIRDFGFDPTDFNIIFRDYENPFPL